MFETSIDSFGDQLTVSNVTGISVQ